MSEDIQDFEDKVKEWEKSFEQMLIEMTCTTTEKGIIVYFEGAGLIREFVSAIDQLRAGVKSEKVFIVAPEGGYPNV